MKGEGGLAEPNQHLHSVPRDVEIASINEGKGARIPCSCETTSGLPAQVTTAPVTDIVFRSVTFDAKERWDRPGSSYFARFALKGQVM